MRVERDAVIEDVMWRGGIGDPAIAETALLAVLDALSTLLPPRDAEGLAAELPQSFAKALAPVERPGGSKHGPATLDQAKPDALYQWLAAAERVHLGIALEHAQAACAALSESFGSEQRILLARRLPPLWAALFAPPPVATAADTPSGPVPGHGGTLAAGRSGSTRPLAEASPPAAQAESVGVENPHADRKLSSTSRSRR